MAKIIEKIVQSKYSPKDTNVLWDDGENLKINRNGKWESAYAEGPAGGAYDDTEIKNKLTELSASLGNKVDKTYVDDAIATAITTTLNTEV